MSQCVYVYSWDRENGEGHRSVQHGNGGPAVFDQFVSFPRPDWDAVESAMHEHGFTIRQLPARVAGQYEAEVRVPTDKMAAALGLQR
jgi:hypothetical protein